MGLLTFDFLPWNRVPQCNNAQRLIYDGACLHKGCREQKNKTLNKKGPSFVALKSGCIPWLCPSAFPIINGI